MAASENTGGSQTASIGTEHTLATITAAGTYQLVVDTNAMVNNDRLELRIYSIPRSGGTERLEMLAVYENVQGEPIKRSIAILSPFSWKATLKQTSGTGRAFPWSVHQT